MTLATYAAVAAVTILVAIGIAVRPRPFRKSLTFDQLNGFARLNGKDPGSGTNALTTFYGWRQDQWTALARGLGALAIAILLALIGATIDASKVVREITEDAASEEAGSVTVTTTEAMTSPEFLALFGAVVILSGGVWLRSRAIHREFADDADRLSKIF